MECVFVGMTPYMICRSHYYTDMLYIIHTIYHTIFTWAFILNVKFLNCLHIHFQMVCRKNCWHWFPDSETWPSCRAGSQSRPAHSAEAFLHTAGANFRSQQQLQREVPLRMSSHSREAQGSKPCRGRARGPESPDHLRLSLLTLSHTPCCEKVYQRDRAGGSPEFLR